jgi:nuclear transport factor 2 (NTF2) superfamily protein
MNQALSTSQLSQATEVTGTVNQSNLINTESNTSSAPNPIKVAQAYTTKVSWRNNTMETLLGQL